MSPVIATARWPASTPCPGGVVCVDLDGTLIAGDLLWESFVALVKRHPLVAIRAMFQLLKGRAQFKRFVAEHVPLDPSSLQYRQSVLDRLHDLQDRQVRIVLATASDDSYARAVADHVGCFNDVIASDGRTNLSGRRKAAALVERYQPNGFHYMGNDWSDLPVWQAASGATVVAASPRLLRSARKIGHVEQVLDPSGSRLRALARALRPHQWLKNVLVFVPLIAAHKVLQLDLIGIALLTFVVFSLSASAIYILNDIVDIQSDRLHPRKKRRPFASGELSIPAGCVGAAALLLLASGIALIGVSWQVLLVLLTYVAVTSAYSLVLKRKPVADVFTLTGLYVLRIVAGGLATGTMLSSWLLAFALFFFLSLAFVKRYAELKAVNGWMPGRGYGPEDALWMHAVGTSSGYMAVLVLALYVNAPEVAALYRQPHVLWLLCPMFLFWLTRLWFRAGRRLVHDDPVVETITDWVSYVTLAAAALVMFAAV